MDDPALGVGAADAMEHFVAAVVSVLAIPVFTLGAVRWLSRDPRPHPQPARRLLVTPPRRIYR